MRIAEKLKELRLGKNLEISDVCCKLQNAGFRVSEDKLLEFEEDAKSLDADTFLVLCKIYECGDVMKVFGECDK